MPHRDHSLLFHLPETAYIQGSKKSLKRVSPVSSPMLFLPPGHSNSSCSRPPIPLHPAIDSSALGCPMGIHCPFLELSRKLFSGVPSLCHSYSPPILPSLLQTLGNKQTRNQRTVYCHPLFKAQYSPVLLRLKISPSTFCYHPHS